MRLRKVLLVALAVGGCEKLTPGEVCALMDQKHLGTDVSEGGDKTIRCVDLLSKGNTYVQDKCTIYVEKKFAQRGLVVWGYRFFEDTKEKHDADKKALAEIEACATQFPANADPER